MRLPTHLRATSLLAAVASPAALAQTTWFVDPAGASPGTGTQLDPFTSLQFAIDQPTTLPGDTLELAGGVYSETIDLGGKDLVIDGSNATSSAVLDAGGAGTALTLQSGESSACVVREVTLRGGIGTLVGGVREGGGLLVDGASATFETVCFEDNGAALGGGAAVTGGSPTFVDCSFDGNSAERGGGLYVRNATVRVSDSSFANNVASAMPGFGGGVHVAIGATFDAEFCAFEDNLATAFGGGGGLSCDANSTSTTIVDSEFLRNAPGDFNGPGSGGAILAMGPLTATRCMFIMNGSVGAGIDGAFQGGGARGGDYVACLFELNSAQNGGGLYGGTALGCRFLTNDACVNSDGDGGGAAASVLDQCQLIDNVACGNGGGAHGSTLTDCRVLYNRANGSSSAPGVGGGLASGDANGCEFLANEANGTFGAGFASLGGGAFASDLTSCVVASNFAQFGGGTSLGTNDRVTVAGNTAEFAGAGVDRGTHVNTIVWHNVSDTTSGPSTFTYSNVELGAAGTGNLSVDPLLFGPAGSDVHLLAGSPCIDTGDPMTPADPDGSPADMGARPFDAAWTTRPAPYCRPYRTLLDGCLPRIHALGEPSLTPGTPVEIYGRNIPNNAFGLLFHSRIADAASITVFGSSEATICIGQPFIRMPVVQATTGPGPCDGELLQTLPANFLNGIGLVPGDRLHAQFWFRQPSVGVGLFAFTDAIEMTVLP